MMQLPGVDDASKTTKPQQDRAQVWKEAPWKWPLLVRKELCGARFLNSRTPAGFKPKPARTIPQKSLTLLSDALKKDDATAWSGLRGSGHFVRKELCGARFLNSRTPAGFKPKPARTIPQKSLTLLSDALKKDDATAWSGLRGSGHFVRKELCGARFLNSRTPAGFKPKPARTIPQKTA